MKEETYDVLFIDCGPPGLKKLLAEKKKGKTMSVKNENAGSVLVLDDEKSNIEIIKNAIAANYNFHYALKPTDALKIMKRVNIDLLLLDILMPEMDGYEFCRTIQNDDALKNIPVIFITGKNDVESVTQGFGHGAVDYITKPFEPSDSAFRRLGRRRAAKT